MRPRSPGFTLVGLPEPERLVGNYVSALRVEDGAIHITFGNKATDTIKGKVLTLRPAVVEGATVVPVAWVCGPGVAPDKMTLRGTNRTDVPTGSLPVTCR